ncbi:MAG TPA: hypothetical protein VFH97_08325 [Gemmatimonadales bacterium]|nr:hypothetical protein [Gemmatimonadales bacterium]
MDERELERIAGRLGWAAGERLDVAAVEQAVLRRLRDAERADRAAAAGPRPVWRWLAAAAAMALMVGGSVVTFRAPPVERSAGGTAATLYDLSRDELAEVLDSLSWAEPVSSRVTVTLEDLDAEQLRELLALMEG